MFEKILIGYIYIFLYKESVNSINSVILIENCNKKKTSTCIFLTIKFFWEIIVLVKKKLT